MLTMKQIEAVKVMWAQGNKKADIIRALSIDRKTVDKYINDTDFNEDIAIYVEEERPSKLDPYKATILQWLNEEERWFHKQRYTAVRIQDRLVTECGAVELKNSYQIIARFLKKARKERLAMGPVEKGTLRLVWNPGEAQADFGEADCYIDSVLTRTKYFILSFPHSNKLLAVFMPGENCECVCRALQMCFEFLGHVPNRIVFDNATGIGRRIAHTLREHANFVRFRMHYGFVANYANPASGWEKGNVENGVGCFRRNRMVPPLEIGRDMERYDLENMLPMSYEFRDDKVLYNNTQTSGELFKEDLEAMSPVNTATFDVRSISKHQLNKYGELVLDNKHSYAMGSEHHDEIVIVEKEAWRIVVRDLDGMILKGFDRSYSAEPTLTYDLESMLQSMVHKPASWINSIVRRNIEDCSFRTYMDAADNNERHRMLTLLNSASQKFDLGMALTAMNELLDNGKTPGRDDVIAYCGRLQDYPAGDSVNPTNVDLSAFDMLLTQKEASNG